MSVGGVLVNGPDARHGLMSPPPKLRRCTYKVTEDGRKRNIDLR